MKDHQPVREVFRSSPFEHRAEEFSLGEGGEVLAQRGYHDDERDDLGRVTLTGAPRGGLAFGSREDVERYRDWMNTSLDAASAAAFGSDATDLDSGI